MEHFIGKPLNHPTLDAFINTFSLQKGTVYEGSKTYSYSNKNKTIGVSVNSATSCIEQVYFEKGKDALLDTLKNYSLLFSVQFYDTVEAVDAKLNTAPFLVHQNTGDAVFWDKVYHHTYFKDDLTIRIYFNSQRELISFSYSAMDDFSKTYLAWQASLAQQQVNKTIDITALKKESPIHRWHTRLTENEAFKAEGNEDYIPDFWYTKERLQTVETILNNYLLALQKQCAENNAPGIENALKKAITALNTFNQSTCMIETDEREELCPFFDATLQAAGLSMPKDFDPTLVYRDW